MDVLPPRVYFFLFFITQGYAFGNLGQRRSNFDNSGRETQSFGHFGIEKAKILQF